MEQKIVNRIDFRSGALHVNLSYLFKAYDSLPTAGSPCLGPASFQLLCGYPVKEGKYGRPAKEVPDQA